MGFHARHRVAPRTFLAARSADGRRLTSIYPTARPNTSRDVSVKDTRTERLRDAQSRRRLGTVVLVMLDANTALSPRVPDGQLDCRVLPWRHAFCFFTVTADCLRLRSNTPRSQSTMQRTRTRSNDSRS